MMKSLLTAILTIVLIVSCTDKKNQDTKPGNRTDYILSDDSLKIHYTLQGNGNNSVILVHGWCFSGELWDSTVSLLKNDYKVITIDLPGFGKSEKSRKNYTMEAYAKDIATVANSLNLENPVLVGHSMGGAVVFEAGKALNGKANAIVGIDCYHDISSKMSEERKAEMLTMFNKNGFKNGIKAFVPMLFYKDTDTEIVNGVIATMQSADSASALSAINNLYNYDSVNDINKLNDTPLISLAGDLFPTNEAKNKEIYPNFSFYYIEGTGHYPMLEKPSKFNNALKEIIDNSFVKSS